jgi:uncharacterized protein YjdB
MVVTAIYPDGSIVPVVGYQIDTANPTAVAGSITVTISFEGVTDSFVITVADPSTPPVVVIPTPSGTPAVVLSGIDITRNPDKTQYLVGEAIDLSGLQVSAVYSNGVSLAISGYSVGSASTAEPGTKTITVSYDGKSSSFTITVVKPELTLDVTQATMKKGESLTLSPNVKPAGLNVTYKFSSSNSSVAAVSADGTITANDGGTATITVSTDKGLSASCSITVLPEVKEIELNVSKKTLGAGEKFTLTHELSPANSFGKVTYKSSKTSIATINADGVITAKKSGKVTITVKAENGVTQSCTITVMKAPTSVKTDKKTLSLKINKTSQIKTTLSKGSAGKLTYTSSNKSIVTVDKNGKLKAKKSGTAYITVKTYNGKTAKVKVSVKK